MRKARTPTPGKAKPGKAKPEGRALGARKATRSEPAPKSPARGHNGQFLVGNCGGAGQPKRLATKEVFAEAVTAEDLVRIMRSHVRRAYCGSVRSAAFVRDTLFGRPTQTHHVDGQAWLVTLLTTLGRPGAGPSGDDVRLLAGITGMTPGGDHAPTELPGRVLDMPGDGPDGAQGRSGQS